MLFGLLKKLISRKKRRIFCEILKDACEEKVTGIVTSVSISDNNLKAFICEEKASWQLGIDDSVKVKFIMSNKEFIFKGMVEGIDIYGSNKTVSVKVREIKIFDNNRKNERFVYKTGVTLYAEEGVGIEGTLVDIGLGGAMIQSENSIPENELLLVAVHTFNDTTVDFKAKIVRKLAQKEVYKYSLSILEIDDDNREILNKLINLLSFEKQSISEEWNAFNGAKIRSSILLNRKRG